MRIKFLIIFVLLLTIIGCGQKTLAEQDAEYYKSMKKIVADFEPIFSPVVPVFVKYLENNSTRKDLNAPAEQLRKQLIALQKRVNDIKPVPGQEGNHQYILASFKHIQDFSEDLIRISEGSDNIYKAKDDFQQGYTDHLKELFDQIKNFKE
jgi:hypothetical protein